MQLRCPHARVARQSAPTQSWQQYVLKTNQVTTMYNCSLFLQMFPNNGTTRNNWMYAGRAYSCNNKWRFVQWIMLMPKHNQEPKMSKQCILANNNDSNQAVRQNQKKQGMKDNRTDRCKTRTWCVFLRLGGDARKKLKHDPSTQRCCKGQVEHSHAAWRAQKRTPQVP